MTDQHQQLKAKCLECGLHFIVCTERAETHNAGTLYCPECGQRHGQYLTWLTTVDAPIHESVPGDSPPTADMKTGEVKSVRASQVTPGVPRKLN